MKKNFSFSSQSSNSAVANRHRGTEAQRHRVYLFSFVPLCLCYFVPFLLVHSVWAEEEKFNFTGSIKNETALKLNRLDEIRRMETSLQLKGEYRFNDSLQLFGIVHKFYDAAFELEDRYKPLRGKMVTNQGTTWLRELYLDILSEKIDIRLGKQQVVWGTADGVRVLDQINPADIRKLLLDDPADYRIPLWMVKIEYAPQPDSSLQFLLIPDFEPNYLPEAGAPFAYRATNLGEAKFDALRAVGFGLSIKEERHSQSLKNSRIGLRWRQTINGWDYTLNYLHNYSPSIYMDVNITPPGPPIPGISTFHFTKKYAQTEMFGGSFSKGINSGALAGSTVRGEFVYNHNLRNGYGTDGNQVGVGKLDSYNYVLGFDKYLFNNYLFSYQFIQYILSRKGYDGYPFLFGPTGGPLDRVETMCSLKVSKNFLHDLLKPEIIIVYGDDNDWRIGPKVSYEISDNLLATAGFQIFEGKEQQLYGEFDKDDFFYFQLCYTF